MSTVGQQPPARAGARRRRRRRATPGAPAADPSPSPGSCPPAPSLPPSCRRCWSGTVTNRFLSWCQRRYGPVFTIRAMPWGRAVHINDADLVKEIFTGDPAVYHAGDGNSMLAPVLGHSSVLVLDDDQHLQARKRLLPPFHGDAVRRYGEVVERIVAEECERWPVGRPFALHPRMRAITFEVILKAVIGVTDPVRLRRRCARCCPATVEIDFPIMLMWIYPWLGRVGRWRRFRSTIDEANRLLREEIADGGWIRRCPSARTCSRSWCVRATSTTRNCATRSSRCCSPATRRRPPGWHGRSSGCCATRRRSPARARARTTTSTPWCARRCAYGPSSPPCCAS